MYRHTYIKIYVYIYMKALIILDKMHLTYIHAHGAESDFKVLNFYT